MSGILVLILRLLLAGILYVFLFWAILVIWRDLKSRIRPSSRNEMPAIRITTTLDNEDLDKHFERGRITIGRDPTSNLTIEEATISWNHATLTFIQGHWWFEDLESTNGSTINDLPVSSPQILVDGDELKCGSVSLDFQILDDGNRKNQNIVTEIP